MQQHDRYRETDPETIWRLVNKAFWEQYPKPSKRAKAFERWANQIAATFGEEVDMAELDFTFWVGDSGALGVTVTRSKPPLPIL